MKILGREKNINKTQYSILLRAEGVRSPPLSSLFLLSTSTFFFWTGVKIGRGKKKTKVNHAFSYKKKHKKKKTLLFTVEYKKKPS